MRKFLLFPLLLLLAACPSNEDSTQASPTPNAENTASAPASETPASDKNSLSSAEPQTATASDANVLRGLFVYGEGYQTFKACGQQEEMWVLDTANKDLQTQRAGLELMDLEPVYVELDADTVPTSELGDQLDGFGLDYKEAVKVKTVKTLRPWVADGSCFTPEFYAEGTRPDWTLQILKDGDVFFKSNEGEFPVVETLAYSAPTQSGNQMQFAFQYNNVPGDDRLQATFTEEACQFAGKDYAYKANLEFRGMSYTGCARRF